jgi:hypothetical protein
MLPVCFITSLFSNDAAIASEIGPVFLKDPNRTSFRHILFTNLPNLNSPSHSWEVVLIDDLPYNRIITQSRWPKFMGWRIPTVQNGCRAVFYSDSYYSPVAPAKEWGSLAAQLTNSVSGVMQNRHEVQKGIFDEFRRILRFHKDTEQNVDASKAWFLSQRDFNNSALVYSNRFLGYDPSNIAFQAATTRFWDHYSKEADSWRDQPLWSYVVSATALSPLSFPRSGLWNNTIGPVRHVYRHEEKLIQSPT